MLLLLARFALAARPDVLADESVYKALAGKCAEAEFGLAARVAAAPEDLAARLALDMCLLAGPKAAQAKEDLASLYTVGAPYDPQILLKRRGVTPEEVERLRVEAQLAAGGLVRQLISQKAYADALLAIRELESQVGECGPLAAMRIRAERLYNGVAAGWKLSRPTVAAWPGDLDVLEEIGLLAYEDGKDMPADLLSAVMSQGRPSAKLNTLLGLARGGRAAECVSLGGKTAVGEEERAALEGTLYRCAVAGKDLTQADARWQASYDVRAQAEHGKLRLDAGRAQDALVIVEPLADRDALALDTALRAWAALGRADALEAKASSLPAGSVGRLTAATSLYNSGHYGNALLLVEGRCGGYAGANATLCAQIAESCHRALGR